MTKSINIQEAKTHLSRWIERVAAGEEIIIAKAGKPMAKLVPYEAPLKKRPLGMLKGQLKELDDPWSDDADNEIAQEFESSELVNSAKRVAESPTKYKKNKKH